RDSASSQCPSQLPPSAVNTNVGKCVRVMAGQARLETRLERLALSRDRRAGDNQLPRPARLDVRDLAGVVGQAGAGDGFQKPDAPDRGLLLRQEHLLLL